MNTNKAMKNNRTVSTVSEDRRQLSSGVTNAAACDLQRCDVWVMLQVVVL